MAWVRCLQELLRSDSVFSRLLDGHFRSSYLSTQTFAPIVTVPHSDADLHSVSFIPSLYNAAWPSSWIVAFLGKSSAASTVLGPSRFHSQAWVKTELA